MRIAYVTETWPPEINGVALTVERTVRFLRAAGHAVLLLRPRQRGEAAVRDDEADEWRSLGLPIPMYPALRFGLASPATLRARLAAFAPEVVHVATQGPLGRAALLAARALELPVTADFRTNFHQYSRYYGLAMCEPIVRGYLRDFHARADCTFVPARALRSRLAASGFARLEVLGRGVDAERFSPARRSAALRARWGAHRDDVPVALYVGRLAAEKNVALALGAAEAMRRLEPRLRTVVVGEGPQRARLEAAFPQALFCGVQQADALAEHYASADFFLFPSRSETFGNVTLEALASGLCVLAYDEAAAAEHVRHGENGLLAQDASAEAFVAAARQAIALAPGERERLRRAARAEACRADWDALLRRFEARLGHFAARAREARARERDVALA